MMLLMKIWVWVINEGPHSLIYHENIILKLFFGFCIFSIGLLLNLSSTVILTWDVVVTITIQIEGSLQELLIKGLNNVLINSSSKNLLWLIWSVCTNGKPNNRCSCDSFPVRVSAEHLVIDQVHRETCEGCAWVWHVSLHDDFPG